jgi:hypothetical protein
MRHSFDRTILCQPVLARRGETRLTAAPGVLRCATVHSDDEPAPVTGWERLAAREAMRALPGLPRPVLERLHSWEDRHLRRTSVLAAIRRAIARTKP